MRIKQVIDNGNVAAENGQILSHINSDNRGWLPNNSSSEYFYNTINRTEHFQFNSNYDNSITSDLFRNNSVHNKNVANETSNLTDEPVCNTLYRLNNRNNPVFLNLNNTEASNLEAATENFLAPRESFLGSNVSSNTTPIEDERPFDHSDTDEMSENGSRPVPRGIVNPNYPGFQHLAHTLQDYSSNIENFYHSENDMTDDDIDLEITESSYEPELNLNETTIVCKNINNNNQEDFKNSKILNSPIESKITAKADTILQKEIPDLLKTISENNNNINRSEFDITCTDTDIENNFHTKDIIGDFNKEIEDEIKQLLNYNINIQDDLEELRKDIKDTFAKPIENTINNISEVVNHVIKKLVETHADESDQISEKAENITSKEVLNNEFSDIKQNETNAITEMNLNRPTFLLIENNTNKITDAFLSDGKDEITLYDTEYDTKNMSNNVENTIKLLSTELRKIIPKLDEMRERDRLWIRNKKEPSVILTDGNFNEVANSSRYTADTKSGSNPGVLTRKPVKVLSEPSAPKEQPKELAPAIKKYTRTAQGNSSVRLGENVDKCDLGSFDVYNIETALPKLDLDAIENHLKAAKEAERRKRNDREEIRKRLAMGADSEEYYSMGHIDRPGKKPSLHSRLQNGKNLQICFMNETASDNESTSEQDRNINYSTKSLSRSSIFSKSNYSLNNHPYQTRPLSVSITKHDKIGIVPSSAKLRPTTLSLKTPKSRSSQSLGHIELKESDFYALQTTLQTEARIALAQAKELARIQMERERRSRGASPVTEMLRNSMRKANAPLAPDRRRVSRQLLTDMNVAQLQVVVNELHSQIESLNESLVQLLMARDELHMGQDSMLVDIEDLTRYLGVKEQTKRTKGSGKSGVRRLASLVHK
ncbi:schwannomin-interacting protein 1 homolog [Leguminivora glycinivorella]|uniref:schwannomin-interacting protein 1 homolog n=1 Tax=Leguminivora glycinivorella TaxID=1035111 RepID=UPI00200BDD65|nr:schwannomin-interacting protein 1 homolog [Leguminivora glycinivorella]